jgi:hypothetical protein
MTLDETTSRRCRTNGGQIMSNVIRMPTREDWERVEAINHELAVRVINLLDERDGVAKEVDRLRSLVESTISMQDVRLVAGEGKLSAHTVLVAVNVILRQRQERLI